MRVQGSNVFGKLGEKCFVVQVAFLFLVGGLIWLQDKLGGDQR